MQKLDNDQRMFVLRMHAEGHHSGAIKRELQSKWQITMNPTSIRETCAAKKYQSVVESFRNSYLQKVKSVPIANKRYRIDDLERERNRINKLIKDNPLTTKSDKALYLSCIGELRRIIDTAREEMEGKPHLFQNVNVQMGEMDDDSIHKRKQELLSKLRGVDGGGITGAPSDSAGAGQEDF